MASDGIETKVAQSRWGSGRTLGDLIGDETANVIEMSGVIKWFDVSKGYGFIVPDNGMADVLLHVTCLRRDGYQTAYEGARVVCEVLQRAQGLQAFRVLSMDESTAIHPAQMPPPRTHVSVTPTSGSRAGAGQMVQSAARIRLPDPRRRHAGHLRAHGDAAPLRHRPSCARASIVLVRFGPGPKGMMAAEVQPESGSLGLSSH